MEKKTKTIGTIEAIGVIIGMLDTHVNLGRGDKRIRRRPGSPETTHDPQRPQATWMASHEY